MVKTIGAYVNVALVDYDESMQNHLVELMKDSLREQSVENILENTWEIVEDKRILYKNGDGEWVVQSEELLGDGLPEISDTRELLEVMTVGLTVKVEDSL
ncbi:hypothetical protein [Desulfosporosinus metallidurans]|uniref:Uncharacterized protein n=1 Tax=Desulfosporosinus metallidurans TaxID=1888891 RepID=A0A1Q8R246_9FIRM|nr:hypothetical protein [Desulfosporosinus metallidurans]OLN33659.1 hypothetical protein DSOL_0369 [Desulfosporosinus metallidurans]